MFDKLKINSIYFDNNNFSVKFYIENFMEILPYLHYANNYNKYYLIINNEVEEDINKINNHLLINKKNPEFDKNNLFLVYSNENQKNWCINNDFQYIQKLELPILENKFVPSIIDKPSWSFKNHQLFFEYYKDANIKIIHIEGLEHNWNIIPYLKNNIYTFVTWPCYFHKWLYEFCTNTLFTLNNDYNKKNIIWLSPDLDGILWAYEFGYSAILCNHNCFIDYNIFKIDKKEIIYNAVMNCRPELLKRPYLAEKIDNLAYIKGYSYGYKPLYDYSKLNYKFLNKERIPSEIVVDIYNQSYCGLIFSETEGACYSSSEYLLSGLPVVSTLSKGGRDTWYTNKNSIIVQPNENDVKDAVEQCIKNIEKNIFNREEIRNSHIQLSNYMRNNFIEFTQIIFDKHKININSHEYWEKTFLHKMKYNLSTEECIQKII